MTFSLLERFRVPAAAAMLAASASWPALAEPAGQNFYAGKQLTIIVGSTVGGGYDLLARLVSRHLGRHIPGDPTIIVQNMPAAGSLAATNHIYSAAPKDGTVIGLIQRGMLLARLSNPTGVRFDVDRLNWLISLNSEVAVTVAWHTSEHKTTRDLFEKELIVGAINGVDPETTPRLYNTLLGTKFKIVTGYPGTAQISLAMERGEVSGIGDWSWSSLKLQRPDWLRDKKITLLLQGALKKEPELGDLPSAFDFVKNDADRKILELYYTQKTVARPVVAPPDIPKERVAILRSAFMALAKDPAFLTEAEKSKIEIGLLSGEEVDKVVHLIASAPADIGERFTKALAAPTP